MLAWLAELSATARCSLGLVEDILAWLSERCYAMLAEHFSSEPNRPEASASASERERRTGSASERVWLLNPGLLEGWLGWLSTLALKSTCKGGG